MSKSKSEQIIDILRELLYTIDERVAKKEAELDLLLEDDDSWREYDIDEEDLD